MEIETPRIGDVWKTHSRKGNLTVRIVTDPSAEWFEAEIVSGKAKYMSDSNRYLQRETGMGTQGDTLTMRRSLVTFLTRLESNPHV